MSASRISNLSDLINLPEMPSVPLERVDFNLSIASATFLGEHVISRVLKIVQINEVNCANKCALKIAKDANKSANKHKVS